MTRLSRLATAAQLLIVLASLVYLGVHVAVAQVPDPLQIEQMREQAEVPRWRPTTRGEVRSVLVDAANRHGADAAVVVALAECESSLRPWVTGDHGSSHGLAQLSDLRGTGLLWHFLAQPEYDDAYDAEQAADYLGRVAAGHYAAEGVTLRRWSCYRR